MKGHPIESGKKVNLFPRLVKFSVRAKINRLLCVHCNNLVHLKCSEICSVKEIKSCDPQQMGMS